MSRFEDATKKDLQAGRLTVFILVILLLLSVIVFLALLANTNGKAAVKVASAAWISAGETATAKLESMNMLSKRWEDFLATPGAKEAALARDPKALELAEKLRGVSDRSVEAVVRYLAEIKTRHQSGMLLAPALQEEITFLIQMSIGAACSIQGAVDALKLADGKPIVDLPPLRDP